MSGSERKGPADVKQIFLAALELEPGAREPFLRDACGADASLRSRVDALLGAHDRSDALDGWLGKGLDVDPLAGDGSTPIGALGDYDLLEKIASGAMGTVYRARQRSLDRIVALKVLRVGRFATEEEVRRFRAEAEAAARLDHPNIVPVYEVGEAERRNFFSMKLIDGPGLDARLGEFRDDPTRAARLVASVARAVHHAHQHGLLHRDLKPSNILLDQEGTPHVADFGVAKRVGDDTLDTSPGVIAGTPAYMAAEQLTAGGEITVRTDVYALGCVLYELMSGRPPFTGRSIADVFHEIREREAPALTELNPAVPGDIALICHKCLSKDPLRRYESMLALAEDLERWLDHVPIQARPTSLLERAALYWRRKPVQASLAATVALLVVTLAIGATTTSFVLREYLNRAVGAEATGRERLRTALLAQARANLRGDRPGRRYESLELLEQAAQIEPGEDLRDEAIKALTLTDLRRIHEWPVPQDERAIAWDFERGLLVSAHRDGRCTVSAWDGTPIAELPPVAGLAWGAAFGPDGRLLIVKYHGPTWTDDPLLVIRDLERDEIVYREERALPNQCLLVHPSGESIVVGSSGNGVDLIDTRTFEVRPWFEAAGHPTGLRFRPDGNELAVTVPALQQVDFRSYPAGELRLRLDLDFEPMCIDWSSDGRSVVVGGGDSVAHVFDAGSGELLQRLEGHQAEVVMVQFLGTELAATSSWDETTRLWDLRTGGTLIAAEETARAHSDDGKLLAYTSRDRAGLWSVDHGDFLRVFHGHVVKGPRWVTVSPSGKWMASGGDDDTLLWSLTENRLVGSLGTGKIGGIAFSGKQDVLYASTEDGLYRWSLGGQDQDPLAVEPELVLEDVHWRFAFDESETVFVASDEHEVYLRHPGDPSRDRVLGGFEGMNRMVLSPDGIYAGAGSWRGRGVRIWNVTTGQVEVDLLEEYTETTAAFSPDGEYLLTGTPDDYSCWRVGTWERLYRIPRSLQPTNLPGSIAFDSTGSIAAVALTTRVIRLLDTATGEHLMTLDAADSFPLTRFSFLPGTTGLAAGTSGRRVLLWNLEGILKVLRERGLAYGMDAWPVDEGSESVTR